MKLKVCGLRETTNLQEVAHLEGVSYIGLIFYEGSKRFVGKNFEVGSLLALPTSIKKMGIFVNSSLEKVMEQVNKYGLDMVQLHGSEDAPYCAALKEISAVPLIKAFGLHKDFDFAFLSGYEDIVDYFLFDHQTQGSPGGTGQAFDWHLLKQIPSNKPFFLSGGLGLENIEELLDFLQNNNLNVHALDVNSRFEITPGLKDIEKLKIFIKQIYE